MSIAAPFAAVPVRARHDGWTPARQYAFVAALRDRRCVAAAARAVGKSWQTAYRLRARPDAAGFAAAWDAALAGPDLTRPVAGRALDGIVTPIMYRGRQVGERRRFDDRLAKYLLRLRCPEWFEDAAPAAHRDPAAAYATALATLESDLAAGLAPCDEPGCDEPDFSADVARGSSPSAPHVEPDPYPSPAKAGAQDRAATTLSCTLSADGIATGPRPPPGKRRRLDLLPPGHPHAHRRHPALRPDQHLRPHPARRDPLVPRP